MAANGNGRAPATRKTRFGGTMMAECSRKAPIPIRDLLARENVVGGAPITATNSFIGRTSPVTP